MFRNYIGLNKDHVSLNKMPANLVWNYVNLIPVLSSKASKRAIRQAMRYPVDSFCPSAFRRD